MDINHVCSVLTACTSPDNTQRQAAEAWLKQHETFPGQSVNLLAVAANDGVDLAVRQAAAISFKNLVRSLWETSERAERRLPDADKALVKEHLLESLIKAPHVVQSQLGEALKIIGYADFPQHWPGLAAALTANLAADDHRRILGALLCLRIIARKYEFKDEEEGREPLTDLVVTCFPRMLVIMQGLLAAAGSPPGAGAAGPPGFAADLPVLLKLTCKIFWSCTYMGIPELLLCDDLFGGWMAAIHSALVLPVPADQVPDTCDAAERAAHPWWKAKKWVYHIAYRLFNRYSVPKHCRGAVDKKFATLFKERVMSKFLEAVCGLVSQHHGGAYVSPRVLNLAFQHLTHAIGVKETYAAMRDHWDGLLQSVGFSLMCFSPDDAALWSEDPQEYIRKGYDIMEDMYSPKTAATNFAHELCGKSASHMQKFMTFVHGVLSAHQQAAASGAPVPPHVASQMDGALLALGTLYDHAKQKKGPYRSSLEGVLTTLVSPCFASAYGHLRSKACWLAGVYADIPFGSSPKGAGPTFSALLGAVVRGLSDPELPVRVDAVVALRHFVDAMSHPESIKPALPQLMTSIFGLMDQVDNEDLVFTLEAIVEKFGADIAPYAIGLAHSLAGAFWKYSAAEEDDDDDDGNAGMAAFGCLRAINTLLDSVTELPELLLPLEEALLPVMVKLLTEDGADVFEDVLEMVGTFTYCSPTLSPGLWQLWPLMGQCLMSWAIDYWDYLLVAFDNYVSRGTDHFLSCRDPDLLGSVYTMVHHSLLGGDFPESDVMHAPKLLDSVLQNCRGRVDGCVAPYIQLALTKLAQPLELRALKDALFCVVANAIYYNPSLALTALHGQGALQMFFAHWFTLIMAAKGKAGKSMKHFRLLRQKKICALALTALLGLPDAGLPAELQAGMPQLLLGLLRLLPAIKEQEEELAQAREEEDDEDDDDDDDEDEDEEELGEAGGSAGGGGGRRGAGGKMLQVDGLGEEEEDEEDEDAYLARITKQAQKYGWGKDGADDEDDDGEDWFDDDDEADVSTPIDGINTFVVFADTLGALQQGAPGRYQSLMAGVASANLQASLAAVTHHAEHQRQEEAAKQAAEQAAAGGTTTRK